MHNHPPLWSLLIIFLVSCAPPRTLTQSTLFIPPKQSTPPITITPSPTNQPQSSEIDTPNPTNTSSLPSPTPSPKKPSPTQTSQPEESSLSAGPPPNSFLFPDSELVFSPTATDFDIFDYLTKSGGFLQNYHQYLMITGWTHAGDVVERVSLENSINPRLLLALLEYQSGWVLGDLNEETTFEYPLKATNYYRKDLYGQLIWAAHELSEGYYGWRDGRLDEFSLADGKIIHPAPDLNPGTIALEYLFGQLYDEEAWRQVIDPEGGFLALYRSMFGDPWERAKIIEPLLPPDLTQPSLNLPFEKGKKWAYTGGPHRAYENNGAWAALDFAPTIEESGCYPSNAWVVAMADGLVVREEYGTVVQDLDGDGLEQTGWGLLYLHIAERNRVSLGTYLKAGERIGHPSCEGGRATGTHLHIARKYNGEWIAADGPIPFVLEGWRAFEGAAPYEGTLIRGDQTLIAHPYGSFETHIIRDD